MKTISIRSQDVKQGGPHAPRWWVVDAAGIPVGRLASQVATVLRGKHKPIFTPHVDTGDFVIVVNAEQVALTGSKLTDKFYYRHTGYPGGIKATRAEKLLAEKPTEVVRLAVKRMLPRNRLNRKILLKLKIYAGPEHPHRAQQPEPYALPY